MHWIAGLIELFAKYMVGCKDKWGFIIHIVSSILWSYVALKTEIYGLLIVTIPAMGMNLWNFWKWHNAKK